MKVIPVFFLCLSVTQESASAASLYVEQSYAPLTADRKARRPGDLITVQVYENSSASSGANTSAGREGGVDAGFRMLHRDTGLSVQASSEMDGRGRTQRDGKVIATLTVSVTQVEANGDLQIEGEQILEVNNEKQQIRLQGRIRPIDISDTNTILSTRIGQAKISYSGMGDVAAQQRPAWWQRVFTWFGI